MQVLLDDWMPFDMLVNDQLNDIKIFLFQFLKEYMTYCDKKHKLKLSLLWWGKKIIST